MIHLQAITNTAKTTTSRNQYLTQQRVEMTVSLSAIERGDDSGHEGELGAVRLERELDRDAADVFYDIDPKKNSGCDGGEMVKGDVE
ncbi:hypothetical protein Tco_0319555 [Tanacetum coccineum]